MRIIAGTLRGRRLAAPSGAGTRPTADRVKEAMFSTLGPVGGLAVLDLYAGTGALGLEALSRGAEHATFVERDRRALEALRENVRALGLEARTSIVALPAARASGAPELRRRSPFDLVFADPPYADVPAAAEALAALAALGLFAPEAVVILEHASRDRAPAIAGALPVDDRAYGDTGVAYYELGALGPLTGERGRPGEGGDPPSAPA